MNQENGNSISMLARLQKLDLELDEKRGELARVPSELAMQDSETEKSADELKGFEDRLQEVLNRQKTAAEMKQEAISTLADYKTKLTTLKTNEEYRAMLRQIEHAEARIDEIDSQSIELMYSEDEARELHSEAAKRHERALERANRRREILKQRASELQSAIEELEESREELVSATSIRLVRKYEQLRAAGKSEAVVGLLNGNCGGCLTVVPPQNAVEIKNGVPYICPICGRYIVWTEDSSFARKS
jgi:predicted  nucleic acid-binding Zn-ribbon protein